MVWSDCSSVLTTASTLREQMRSVGAAVLALALLAGSVGSVAGRAADEVSSTAELLAGMVTEDVFLEPGVLRVVNDGVRDLASPNNVEVVTGLDGSVWLRRKHRDLQLGTSVALRRVPIETALRPRDFGVAPDGTVWTIEVVGTKRGGTQRRLRLFDGQEWTTVKRVPESAGVQALDVDPEGNVWTAWLDPESRPAEQSWVVARLASDGWHLLERPLRAGFIGDLEVTDKGEVWVATWPDGPARYVDGAWQWPLPGSEVAPPGNVGFGVPIGPDGTLWQTVESLPAPGTAARTAARSFDGRDWRDWGPADGFTDPLGGQLRVARDGTVWGFSILRGHGIGPLSRFDGTDVRSYLEDVPLSSWGIAEDGAVWALGDPAYGESDLYVILPEPVAAE